MSQITELAAKLFNPSNKDFPIKTLATEKRVRGVLNGKYIFDTTGAYLVWESKFFPQYWIPKKDFLPAAKFTEDKPTSGIQSSTSTLAVDGKEVKALIVPDSFNSELAGLVKVDFKALDAWYEEQTQVLYHPKDPYHRVDVLPSGRHVKVELEGKVLADTGTEGGVMSLWETSFPGRWYLPRTAVNWEYLKPSETHTGCPYKGQASYYDAVIDGKTIKDVVWWYPQPMSESGSIVGMLCFYPDKVKTWVDGKEIAKVGMPLSKKEMEDVKKSVAMPKQNGEEKKEHDHGYGKSCNC
jgi:uncharacterized protein (DUF427 family)